MRKRRLDLGLFQKEVADRIGVVTDTITNWELNRFEPEIRSLPKIIQFLGYNPLPVAQSTGQGLRRARETQGLSIKAMARRMGVDPSTLARWERGDQEPQGRFRQVVNDVLLPVDASWS